MTMAGDFGTNVGADEEGKGANQTNLIIGVAIGVVGLLAAGFLVYSQVLPAMEQNTTLKAELDEKGSQVRSGQELENLLQEAQADQALAEQQSVEIQTLFADDKSLQTLLLDINRILRERGVELIQFQPDSEGIQLVADGSLGAEVDGKLRSRSYELQFAGNFDQTRLVLLDIERLQPLLTVESMELQVDSGSQQVLYQDGLLVAPNEPKLTTQMQIKALLPTELPPPAPPGEEEGAEEGAEEATE
ncbi:hypothetical protein [Roseofilum casamattae]|uniref:Type IV pilus assembly protein PilO n=1 Tax=Roseofilum casamattae BLCC-M143 TaxID=3022442 RepID=A0ABT7BY30_9CYAN|nr:hypothetical protein [Roseofilum casamattae]MDJ1183188.1 hypothetical protein [Roseofilum casamattae BLCC-M143]